MNLVKHVLKAIKASDEGDKDEALFHACFAIDATARKLFNNDEIGRSNYKKCLRQYMWIIERFVGEGINLEETKFTNLELKDRDGKLIQDPDIADVIYHIFRCSNAHAKEISINFSLLAPNENGNPVWKIGVNNILNMPEQIIWAILAVSVFCKANLDVKTDGEEYLSWRSDKKYMTIFKLKDFWGKEDELKNFFSDKPQIRVKLDLSKKT